MKLLILFGPPAAGKFSVGKCLEEQTDFKLFHNHAIMDGVMHIFGKGSPAEDRLSRLIRESVITEAADAGINLIFTYVWNFAKDKGKNNIDAYKQAYESRGGVVYFVELTASVDVRAQRAANPDRFDGKAHTAGADEVRNAESFQKFVSPSPFYYPDKYLQIDTTDKPPETIAHQITDWLHHM
jgi:chloramphenicol 3-O-phosphotransferase